MFATVSAVDVNESQRGDRGQSCGWRVRENIGLMHYSKNSKQIGHSQPQRFVKSGYCLFHHLRVEHNSPVKMTQLLKDFLPYVFTFFLPIPFNEFL